MPLPYETGWTMDSVWDSERAAPPPPASWGAAVPVAVIGGGIAGLAVAYWLARAAVEVALFERERVAAGASGRNAGFLLTGPADYYAAAIERWGADTARAVWRFSEENRGLLRATWREEGVDARWQPTGHLYLADDVAEADALVESHRRLEADGFASQLWDAPACREAAATDRFELGRFTPGDGQFHPVRAVTGLAAAAVRRGVRIHERTPVTKITARGGAWRLTTPTGPVAAERVVLAAAGPGVVALWPRCAGGLTAVRAQALATPPAPVRLAMPLATRYGGVYWRQREDGALVLGGERSAAAGADVGVAEAEPSPEVQAGLDRFLARTYPGVPRRVVGRWAGTMTYTPSGLPWVGPAPGADGLDVMSGWSGHGFAFAWEAGRRLAGLIAGLRSSLDLPWPSPEPSAADTG